MQTIDYDLLSIQEARILAENSRKAQRELSKYSQEDIDGIVIKIIVTLKKNVNKLAKIFFEETEAGNYKDKVTKINLVIDYLEKNLSGMKCVGVISKDEEKKVFDIGVPIGVILAFCSEANSITTLIYKSLISIKSGNSIIFNLENSTKNSMVEALNLIIKASTEAGLPEGSISYLKRISSRGSRELIYHPDVSLIINTGVNDNLKDIYKSGKMLIYGSFGSTPVFIERTANIKKSVKDIVVSKSFDNGLMPGGEQSVIIDKPILEEVIKEFKLNKAYFMSSEESSALKSILFDKDQNFEKKLMGKAATFLAKKANFEVPKDTKLLISKEKFASHDNPYAKEKLCPVVAFYVEENWKNACEKCIELLVNEKQGHSLILHSNDKEVIGQFSLKKPVGRILINTSGTFGSMGVTTNLFPAMTLGSGVLGKGMSSDNVSPLNLIYIRKVAHETQNIEEIFGDFKENVSEKLKSDLEETLKKIIKKILKL